MKLRGITWDNERGYDPLMASARAYQTHHPGIEIQWEKRTLQQFADFPIEKLADTYDLLMIDHPWVGTAAAAGSLVPLETVLPQSFLSDQEAQSVGASYRSYNYAGHQWALAIDAAAQVSAFRPDLLDDVPADWDAVLSLARARAHSSQWRVAMPLIPVDAICTFFSLCASWGEPAGIDAHRLVSRDMGRRVLDWMRALVGVAHPASLACDPPAMLDRMAETDEIAYVPLLFGYCNYARPGYRPHLIRFADIPSSGAGSAGAILGGVGLAISSRSAFPAEAASYAQWVAGPQVQCGLFFEAGGQPGNRLAWLDPDINRECSGFFLDTLETLDHAYVRPRYDRFLDFQTEAGEIIHDFLSRGGETDTTLHAIEAAYQKTRERSTVMRGTI